MLEIENPINRVKQTPDACVTACLQACLGNSFEELIEDLSKHRVPYSEDDNPTDNPCYFDSDGIIDVLTRHNYYVGLHISADQTLTAVDAYRGNRQTLDLRAPQYCYGTFTKKKFIEYISDNLKQGRYLLPWLDNRKYSPKGFARNRYEQHVIVIYGINPTAGTVTVMDPDATIQDEFRTFTINVNHLFDSLWRRPNQQWAMEKIIVLGTQK
jgi:hypothetical protein